MLQDLFGLPTMGGALLGGTAYAALSLLVTGPLVAERTIEKSGWPARCARQSLADAMPEAPHASSIDCGAILGLVYGKEGEAFCARHGDALVSAVDLLGSARTLVRDATGAIAARRAASDTHCACAVRSVLEDRRVDLALYAGTARLVTPFSVRSLDAELTRAAQAPACAAGGRTR